MAQLYSGMAGMGAGVVLLSNYACSMLRTAKYITAAWFLPFLPPRLGRGGAEMAAFAPAHRTLSRRLTGICLAGSPEFEEGGETLRRATKRGLVWPALLCAWPCSAPRRQDGTTKPPLWQR